MFSSAIYKLENCGAEAEIRHTKDNLGRMVAKGY